MYLSLLIRQQSKVKVQKNIQGGGQKGDSHERKLAHISKFFKTLINIPSLRAASMRPISCLQLHEMYYYLKERVDWC